MSIPGNESWKSYTKSQKVSIKSKLKTEKLENIFYSTFLIKVLER